MCRALIAMGHSYRYEPHTFDLGTTRYTPDLLVDDSYWIEVKGWMTEESQKKIAQFRERYPNELLILVDRPIYEAIEAEWSDRILQWEHKIH